MRDIIRDISICIMLLVGTMYCIVAIVAMVRGEPFFEPLVLGLLFGLCATQRSATEGK